MTVPHGQTVAIGIAVVIAIGIVAAPFPGPDSDPEERYAKELLRHSTGTLIHAEGAHATSAPQTT